MSTSVWTSSRGTHRWGGLGVSWRASIEGSHGQALPDWQIRKAPQLVDP